MSREVAEAALPRCHKSPARPDERSGSSRAGAFAWIPFRPDPIVAIPANVFCE